MIINRTYIFAIGKKFSCKKRGTQPHKSAQENPFKKFIELISNKSNRLEHNLNFQSRLQYLLSKDPKILHIFPNIMYSGQSKLVKLL